MTVKPFDIECAGYSVSADWYEGESTDHITLSLIGWTSSKARHSNFMEGICKATGSSGLVFDYSGHGDSDIDPLKTRPAQHFLEVICVFDWIKNKYPAAKITVMGSSYGGYMAANLSQNRRFDNLVLRAPAIYLPQDFYTLGENRIASTATDGYRWDKKALSKDLVLVGASEYAGKTFVIAHENDEICHKPSIDAYISAFNADSWVAPKAPHGIRKMSADWLKDYQEKISDWINAS